MSETTIDLSRKRSALAYRISLVRDRSFDPFRARIGLPIQAAEACRHFLAEDLDREIFGALLVNTRNVVIGFNLISIGSVNGSLVHPREVYKAAIAGNASAIVCFHNHPSGDPSPSSEDRALTARLKQAGSVLGIELLDHIVLSGEHDRELGERSGSSYYSFRESGEL